LGWNVPAPHWLQPAAAVSPVPVWYVPAAQAVHWALAGMPVPEQ
jgi:hypothetical protein